MKIVHVVGARPNFMKMAPAFRALAQTDGVEQTLVHTGQHYDANMSDVFFRQLGVPPPDVNLEVGSGSHAVQTAHIMVKFEELMLRGKPDIVLVYGDVNSTVAATLVCAKLGIRVAHVEAGLRSFDREMPEEINRLVTDQLADLLFTPSRDGDENLKREGVATEKIHLVGNLMIDTLVRLLDQAHAPTISGINGNSYALVTLHRPSNVDEPAMLRQIVETLNELSARIPIVFPIHPRTRQRITDFRLPLADSHRFALLEPIGYLEFLALQRDAQVVVTDSGGIQEETTYLGVPCLTVRENTERPVTVELGTNILVGRNMERLKSEAEKILCGNAKTGAIPPLWDGKAGERVAAVVLSV
jgi:UDP-N-acetylglucosamine 2-epimerase (non-hydrolysing)